MTTVVFLKRKNEFCGFTVKGHSGYAPAGEDIVCAAVSSSALLIANIALSLERSVEAESCDGFLSLFVPKGKNIPQYLFNNFLTHLLQISKQYPENLQVCLLND